MSTLKDITRQANNAQQRSQPPTNLKRSSPSSDLGMRDENSRSRSDISDSTKPHFMTSTSASRAQKSTTQLQSRPTTPASLSNSDVKRSGWMASAGRRLGFTTPKSGTKRKASSEVKAPGHHTTKSSRIESRVIKSEGRVSSPGNFVVNRQRSFPPRQESPPDKPLPSIPVATFTTSSPVHRRSLIDASEKPLQRSMSPSPGVVKIEGWPALSPLRLPTNDPITKAATQEHKPVEAMTEDTENRPVQPTQSSVDTLISPNGDSEDGSPTPSLVTSQECVEDPIGHDVKGRRNISRRTVSSTASITAAFNGMSIAHPRTKDNAQKRYTGSYVRQTMTSAMRLQSATANQSKLPQPVVNDAVQEIVNGSMPSPSSEPASSRETVTSSQRLSTPGPIRSKSKSRRSVLSNGSPYSHPIRSHAKLVDIKRRSDLQQDGSASVNTRARPASADSTKLQSTLVAVKETRPTLNAERRSFIPLPRRLARDSLGDESEAEVAITKLDKKEKEDQTFLNGASDDADVDTDLDIGLPQDKGVYIPSPIISEEAAHDIMPQSTDTVEPLETLDERGVEFPNDQGESDVGSLHDFAGFDSAGYRVKRLSTKAPKYGPTLRISRVAETILSGDGEVQRDDQLSRTSSRRNSAPDLRLSLVMRDAKRLSKEGLKIHLPRSLTVGSLHKHDSRPSQELQLDKTTSECHEDVLNNKGSPDDTPCSSKASASPPSLDKGVTDHENNGNWPLKQPISPHSGLNPIAEKLAEEDLSWISPLQEREWTHNIGCKQAIVTPESRDPPYSPTSSVALSQPYFLADTTASAYRRQATSCEPHDNAVATSHTPHCPSRGSSRLQVRQLQSTSVTAVVDRGPVTRAIPNRFVSPFSSPSSKGNTVAKCAIGSTETITKLSKKPETVNMASLAETRTPVKNLITPSTASKGALSNFRGLFHKKSADNRTLNGASIKKLQLSPRRKKVVVKRDSSPHVRTSRPLQPANVTSRNIRGLRTSNATPRNAFASPSNAGTTNAPTPDSVPTSEILCNREGVETNEMKEATRLAFEVLELAKAEDRTGRKGELVDLGKLLVQAVQTSQDAEKALEEAKQAAMRAEVAALQTREKVKEIVEVVGRLDVIGARKVEEE